MLKIKTSTLSFLILLFFQGVTSMRGAYNFPVTQHPALNKRYTQFYYLHLCTRTVDALARHCVYMGRAAELDICELRLFKALACHATLSAHRLLFKFCHMILGNGVELKFKENLPLKSSDIDVLLDPFCNHFAQVRSKIEIARKKIGKGEDYSFLDPENEKGCFLSFEYVEEVCNEQRLVAEVCDLTRELLRLQSMSVICFDKYRSHPCLSRSMSILLKSVSFICSIVMLFLFQLLHDSECRQLNLVDNQGRVFAIEKCLKHSKASFVKTAEMMNNICKELHASRDKPVLICYLPGEDKPFPWGYFWHLDTLFYY